jgi:hypothetical protein
MKTLGLLVLGVIIFLANGIEARKKGKKRTAPSYDPQQLDVFLKVCAFE